MAVLIISLVLVVFAAQPGGTTDNYSTLSNGTEDYTSASSSGLAPSSTTAAIPLADTQVSVILNVLTECLSLALLALAVWLVVVSLVGRAHKRNNFVLIVVNLAVADVVLASAQLVLLAEWILAPNSWGGLSSALFSPEATLFWQGIAFVAYTQHYLAMAIVAGERLYAIARPVKYQARGPPVVGVAVLLAFFAANLVVTVCGSMINFDSMGALGYIPEMFFVNMYLANALVAVTVVFYAALIVLFRWQARKKIGHGASNANDEMKLKRQMQFTRMVFKVGAVFFCTAFLFNVISIGVSEPCNAGLIDAGTCDVATDLVYIPLTIGEIVDLLIFTLKIEEIKQASKKYLKMVCYCGKPPQAATAPSMSRRTTRQSVTWARSAARAGSVVSVAHVGVSTLNPMVEIRE